MQRHGVGGGDERAGSKRPTEATQLLRRVRVTVMYVQEIITAQSVCLEVKNPEGERDHVAFWDLTEVESQTCLAIITALLTKLSTCIQI